MVVHRQVTCRSAILADKKGAPQGPFDFWTGNETYLVPLPVSETFFTGVSGSFE